MSAGYVSSAPVEGADVALVLGGSGTVGSAVVRALGAAGFRTHFTYYGSTARAEAISAACPSAVGVRVDLRRDEEIRTLFRRLDGEGVTPRLLVHCAAVSHARKLTEISTGDWEEVLAVGPRAALAACQELAPRLARAGLGGEIVLVGALDRGQSLPLPVHFAGAQGMLGAMTMALAKELGPLDIRVNLLALGPLGAGLSQQLPDGALGDFKNFSALRRLGSPDEVARAVLWLGRRNTFMTGKVLAVNGGI